MNMVTPLMEAGRRWFKTEYVGVVNFRVRKLMSQTTCTRTSLGTRKAMPVSLPFSSGMTLPTALAAPVDEGMMF